MLRSSAVFDLVSPSVLSFHKSATTTMGNSRPLAACTVRIFTASTSLSMRRLTSSAVASRDSRSAIVCNAVDASMPLPSVSWWMSSTRCRKSVRRRSARSERNIEFKHSGLLRIWASTAAIPSLRMMRERVRMNSCSTSIPAIDSAAESSPPSPVPVDTTPCAITAGSSSERPKNMLDTAARTRPMSLGRSMACNNCCSDCAASL